MDPFQKTEILCIGEKRRGDGHRAGLWPTPAPMPDTETIGECRTKNEGRRTKNMTVGEDRTKKEEGHRTTRRIIGDRLMMKEDLHITTTAGMMMSAEHIIAVLLRTQSIMMMGGMRAEGEGEGEGPLRCLEMMDVDTRRLQTNSRCRCIIKTIIMIYNSNNNSTHRMGMTIDLMLTRIRINSHRRTTTQRPLHAMDSTITDIHPHQDHHRRNMNIEIGLPRHRLRIGRVAAEGLGFVRTGI